MADSDFFNKVDEALQGKEPEAVVPEVTEPVKVKVGEEEYTQEELERYVGLGKIGAEAEEKYKTPINRVWPEFTKKSQQLSEYETKIKELESKTVAPAVNQPLTPEQRAEAVRQLDDLLKDSTVLKDTSRNTTREELQAKDLLNDVALTISNAEEAGLPKSSVADVLDYMQTTGIRNPDVAYRAMFQDEIIRSEAEKIASLKKTPMVTTTQTTAGGKTPAEVKITKENLARLVEEELSKGSSI